MNATIISLNYSVNEKGELVRGSDQFHFQVVQGFWSQLKFKQLLRPGYRLSAHKHIFPDYTK